MKRSRKIAVVGFRAVGKSAVTIQFAENHFAEAYNPTVENTFHKTLKHKGVEYELEIIDTAGQDEQSIMPFRGTIGIDGYVMVYSVASRTSLETVKVLNEKIINETGTDAVPRVLVGNKSDLVNDRSITTDEGRRTAEELNCAYIECSAKLNENVSQVFITILEEIEKQTAPEEPVQESKCVLC
jgi:Ras family protein